MKKLILLFGLLLFQVTSYSQYQIVYNTGNLDILNFCSYYNNQNNNTYVYLLENGVTGTYTPPSWLRFYRNTNQWLSSPHTAFHQSSFCFTGTGSYTWMWLKNFIRSSEDTNLMLGQYQWASCTPPEGGINYRISWDNGITATTSQVGYNSYDIDPVNDSIVYGIGNTYLSQPYLWKSTNKGVNFSQINLNTSLTSNPSVHVNPLNHNEVFLFNRDTLYKSTNQGNNFSYLTNFPS